MELHIIENKEGKPLLKCTVQRDGQILFGIRTSKELSICGGVRVKFATNEKEELFLVVGTPCDAESYDLHPWSGNGWYIKAQGLLKSLNLNYKKNKTIFDISPANEVYEGCKVYQLTPRTQLRNIKK